MSRLKYGALALAFMVSPALAADLGGSKGVSMIDGGGSGTPYNWTGVWIGGQVGYATSRDDLHANYVEQEAVPASCATGNTLIDNKCWKNADVGVDGKPVKDAQSNDDAYIKAIDPIVHAFDVNGIGGSGWVGGGKIGADYAVNRMLFGVFADYNIASTAATAGYAINDTGIASASIREGNSWLVGGRAGVLLGSDKSALIYGLAGYGQQDVTYAAAYGTETWSKDITFSGWTLGAGAELMITKWASIGLEWQHAFLDTETLVDVNGLKIETDRETDKIMAVLRVKAMHGSGLGF